MSGDGRPPIAGGRGERRDRAGDPYRDVQGNDESDDGGSDYADDRGPRQGVADVTFGFHRSDGECEQNGTDRLSVDGDRRRHCVGPRDIDVGHAVHLHHHRSKDVGWRANDLTVGIDDRQGGLTSGCHCHRTGEVGVRPAAGSLVTFTGGNGGGGQIVGTLPVGEVGHLGISRRNPSSAWQTLRRPPWPPAGTLRRDGHRAARATDDGA